MSHPDSTRPGPEINVESQSDFAEDRTIGNSLPAIQTHIGAPEQSPEPCPWHGLRYCSQCHGCARCGRPCVGLTVAGEECPDCEARS